MRGHRRDKKRRPELAVYHRDLFQNLYRSLLIPGLISSHSSPRYWVSLVISGITCVCEMDFRRNDVDLLVHPIQWDRSFREDVYLGFHPVRLRTWHLR